MISRRYFARARTAVLAVLLLVCAAAYAQTGLYFVPVTPCRVADTRTGYGFSGAFGPPSLAAASSRSFPIQSSSCGIPSTAAAYAINIAVVPQGPLAYLTAWPTGSSQPYVATLTSDGRVKSNAAIIPAGTGSGGVSFFSGNVSGSYATDLIIDINGYFVSSSTALAFYPLTPCRMVDTRTGYGFSGSFGPPSLSGGATRTFPLQSSSCGVPSTAQAYSLNFSAIPPGPLGYITAWPTGQSQPTVSSLNDPTGTVVANAGIVPAGTNGSINVFASANTDLTIDINGYFAPPGSGGLTLYTVAPCRVLDTRNSSGAFTGELDVNVTVSGCIGSASQQAYLFNATVVPSGVLGFLTLWAQGSSQPNVSTLNAQDGAITSNMAVVPTNYTEISAYASSSTNLILDLFGYFAPPGASGSWLQTFTSCVSASDTGSTCTLPSGTYDITSTIDIERSGITVTGGSTDRTQTVLIRDRNFTGPLIGVGGSSSTPLTGITIQNLTVCGGGVPSLSYPSPSPTCPSPQASTCANDEVQANQGAMSPLCVDLQGYNSSAAGTGYDTTSYSTTISNVDFEEATGHAIALYPTASGAGGQRANDIHIIGSAVNSSAVTGVLLGANQDLTSQPDYNDRKVCDNTANYATLSAVPFPSHIVIEQSTFQYNNTGVIGGTARAVTLQNNAFLHNFINPQIPGNLVGGNVFLDQCSDTVSILNNTMDGSQSYQATFGLELWGRNITAENNTIYSFPNQGLEGNSPYNLTVTSNTIYDNDTFSAQSPQYATGGILVATREAGLCQQIPRDASGVTISSNSVYGQHYGVQLFDSSLLPSLGNPPSWNGTRNSIGNLSIASSNYLQGSVAAVGQDDAFIRLNAYSGTSPTILHPSPPLNDIPRALTIDVNDVWPRTHLCMNVNGASVGADQETFKISGADLAGSSNLVWMETIATTVMGPAGGARSCHLGYQPSSNTVFLDDQYAGYTWGGGYSVVGTGGSDLSNGYCTIHAGSSASQVQSEPLILDLTLSIQFPSQSSSGFGQTYFYSFAENNSGVSNSSNWKYWGSWATP